MVNFTFSEFHLSISYTCEVLKILRNKVSRIMLLIHFQFCVGRVVDRIINSVITRMILGSTDKKSEEAEILERNVSSV